MASVKRLLVREWGMMIFFLFIREIITVSLLPDMPMHGCGLMVKNYM